MKKRNKINAINYNNDKHNVVMQGLWLMKIYKMVKPYVLTLTKVDEIKTIICLTKYKLKIYYCSDIYFYYDANLKLYFDIKIEFNLFFYKLG